MRLVTAAMSLLLAGAGACFGGDEDRLIQRDDSQFDLLETPEESGECAQNSDCVDSCVHSCIPIPTGPMTCPIEPAPLPERLVGAECACAGARCKWL